MRNDEIQRREYHFLQWFYENVEDHLGPGSHDIYIELKIKYEKEGYDVPNTYKRGKA